MCLSACGTTETSSNPTNTPSESQTDMPQNTDEITSAEPDNSQVSSNTEETKENDTQTQNPVSQSKPTNTTNPPTHTHSYSNATCTSPKKCSCGATAGTALGHQFSSATCTSPQICSRCGNTSGNALGHNYSAANCNSPKTCTRCGQTSGSALGHNYVNNKCSRCGKVDPDSLPVGLDKVVVIDSKDCTSNSGTLTDSFGNTYNKSIQFNVWDDIYSAGYYDEGYSYSLYNLSNKYRKFNATVAVPKQAASNANFKICIYLNDDNKPIYTKQNFNKTTAPFNIAIDVSNASKMRIEVYMEGIGHEVDAIIICQQFDMLALVNTQLTK